MIIFTTIDFLLHRFSYTHTKKHLQRALKAPCRCLEQRTDARAGRTAIALVQRLRQLLECVCVCVCYTFIWFYQIKDVKTYTAWKIIFRLHTNTFCLIQRQRYKLLRKATNLLVKNVSREKRIMPKTTRCGQQKDGTFWRGTCQENGKSGRNKGRYAARCHLTAFDGEKPSLSVILFLLQ